MIHPLEEMIQPQEEMVHPLGKMVYPQEEMVHPLGKMVHPQWEMVHPHVFAIFRCVLVISCEACSYSRSVTFGRAMSKRTTTIRMAMMATAVMISHTFSCNPK